MRLHNFACTYIFIISLFILNSAVWSQPKSLPEQNSSPEQEIWNPSIEGAYFEKKSEENYYLHVNGKAPLQLEGGRLNIGLFYFGSNLGWITTPDLQRKGTEKFLTYQATFYNFSQNNKYSLSGPYEVSVYFIPTRQNPLLEEKFKAIVAKKAFTPDTKVAYLRDEEQFLKEEEWLHKFYAERIVIGRILLRQLLEKSNQAAMVAYNKDPNPFAKESEADAWPRAFDVKKWETWLKEEWEAMLKQEENKVKDHKRKFIALRYPDVHANLILIYGLLRKYAYAETSIVYNANQIADTTPEDMRMNLPIQLSDHNKNIERVFETIRKSRLFPMIEPMLKQISETQYQKLGYKKYDDPYVLSQEDREKARSERRGEGERKRGKE